MPGQRLLVSVRGPKEAIQAVRGGAHIIDAEYPRSALGTPYPINIATIRKVVRADRWVSTNIGEKQFRWSTASQAALGVALAGADIIKAGLAGLETDQATEVMERIVRSVKWWFPNKQLIATVFADPGLREFLDPMDSIPSLKKTKSDGILVDTFAKMSGNTLVDRLSSRDIRRFAQQCHRYELEAWIAGSITLDMLPRLWRTGVDVICVRGAACVKGADEPRMGKVSSLLVTKLVATIP